MTDVHDGTTQPDDRALMIIVERIVRPIAGSFPRKMRYRQELLSHLREIYDEELKAGHSSAEAIANASARFGEPETIRIGLQQATSLWERLNGIAQSHLRRSGESRCSWAARMGVLGGLIHLAFVSVAIAVVAILQDRSPMQFVPGFMVFLSLVYALDIWLLGWIGGTTVDRIMQADNALRRPYRELAFGAVASAVVMGCSVTALMAWTELRPELMLRMGIFAGLAALFLYPVVCMLHLRERQQAEPWSILDLDVVAD